VSILIRTTADDKDFHVLVQHLNHELADRDGDEHDFYKQYNTLKNINHVIVYYDMNIPVACGALKPFNSKSVEIKRMFTQPKYRGQGIARKVLLALEQWAIELGYYSCVLETGLRNPEAIGLYKNFGYLEIPNYGQYAGVSNSICFEKILSQ